MEVRLFATLRENRGKTAAVPWREGLSGHGLLETLGIKEREVSIFLVNGMHSKPDVILRENDIVALFPPVGGG